MAWWNQKRSEPVGMGVSEIRSVDLGMTDIPGALAFLTSAWLLEVVGEQNGITYLSANGRHHHVLSVRRTDRPAILRIVLGAASRAAVDALHRRASTLGVTGLTTPEELTTPGGGTGFELTDPEGRRVAVVAAVADRAEPKPARDRPTKISHVNLNSGNNDAAFTFWRDVLGFKLSDQTKRARFMRCNADHHSVVLGFNQKATLNHIAFEMPDIDSLMRGIGRMRDHGYPIEWGPGRHGPGNNVFAYFVGPELLPLEYTTEVEQCGDEHVPRMPEQWGWPKGRLDHWGLTPGPSARFEATQETYVFPPPAV